MSARSITGLGRARLAERVHATLRGAAAACGALVCVLAPSLLPACNGEVGAPAGSATQTKLTSSDGLDRVAPPSFLVRMPDAPERVAHRGLRRVEYHYDVDGVPTDLVYEERIVADGTGRYAIEPVSVSQPALSTSQREIFEEMQRARQGFFFKYRDLRVRDVALFLENYDLTVVPGSPVVAGVECVDLQVVARHGAARAYRIAVDPQTGLVMSAVERDASGAIVASTTFVEFTLDPALDGVVYHVDRYPGVALEGAAIPAGFAPARPQILPEGFREISSETFELERDTYVRRVYGDGLEHVFFLQRGATDASPASVATAGTTQTVRIAELGSFRIAEAVRANGALFVVGKVSEADVLAILRSAL